MKLDTLSLLLGILIGILIVVILLMVYSLVVNCWEALRDREEKKVDLPVLAAEKEAISCALAEIVLRCEWIKESEGLQDYAKALETAIEYLENRKEEIDEIQQEYKGGADEQRRL